MMVMSKLNEIFNQIWYVKYYIPKTRLDYAYKYSQWHLFLEKYAYAVRFQCDDTAENNKEFKKRYPSGKFIALEASAELANSKYLLEYCENKHRFLDNLKQFCGSRYREIELVNESKLMVHLGKTSALENVGLYADRTTGLPIIPGTSLKGVLSAWAIWEANKDIIYSDYKEDYKKYRQRYDSDLAKRIFGDDSKDGSKSAGEIIFVGGFPKAPPVLELDIVNPHHDEDGKDKENLTPNPFLSVKEGIIWRFVFFARKGVDNDQELLETTERWLKEALTQYGIGAKTAAGYGKFREVTDKDKENYRKRIEELVKSNQGTVKDEKGNKVSPTPQPTSNLVTIAGDYPNEEVFKNRVLNNLEPSKFGKLQIEIEILKKPENQEWLEKFKAELKKPNYKDIRKKLKEKDWFPKEWLPQ
jgi:CRISPR-associated protein Cmr6